MQLWVQNSFQLNNCFKNLIILRLNCLPLHNLQEHTYLRLFIKDLTALASYSQGQIGNETGMGEYGQHYVLCHTELQVSSVCVLFLWEPLSWGSFLPLCWVTAHLVLSWGLSVLWKSWIPVFLCTPTELFLWDCSWCPVYHCVFGITFLNLLTMWWSHAELKGAFLN